MDDGLKHCRIEKVDLRLPELPGLKESREIMTNLRHMIFAKLAKGSRNRQEVSSLNSYDLILLYP